MEANAGYVSCPPPPVLTERLPSHDSGCSRSSKFEVSKNIRACVRKFSDGESPLETEEMSNCFKTMMWTQFLGEAFWILSEVGWILLIPVLCLPAGMLALVFMIWSSILDVHASKRCEWWLPQALQVEWLFANCVWMADEMLWDSPDQQTPWVSTPVFKENEKLYDRIQNYCIIGFVSVTLLWFLSIAVLHRYSIAKESLPSPARGLFFQSGHIAMWSLMDSLWASSSLWPSVLCCVVTICMLIANASFETGLSWRGVDRTDVVWILWTFSNLLWILLELRLHDNLIMRYYAAMVGCSALALLLCSFEQMKIRMQSRAESLYQPSFAESSRERLLSN